MNPIEMLLDENSNENIILFNEQDQPMEFEQIAVIPINGIICAILRPVGENTGLEPDEALVFCIAEDDEGMFIQICEDDALIDAVFEEYYRILKVRQEEL